MSLKMKLIETENALTKTKTTTECDKFSRQNDAQIPQMRKDINWCEPVHMERKKHSFDWYVSLTSENTFYLFVFTNGTGKLFGF